MPENRLKSLYDKHIFVFGSNLQGHHAGGAANDAVKYFGAVWGQGEGLQGQSYAIPTMQGGPETIAPYVDRFVRFAEDHPELTFYVTRIGCGIAGLRANDIAPLFREALPLENVLLPRSFAMIILALELDGSRNAAELRNVEKFDATDAGFERREIITADHCACYTLFRKDGRITLGAFEETDYVSDVGGWYYIGGLGAFDKAMMSHDHDNMYKGYLALRKDGIWLILSVDCNSAFTLICEDEDLENAKAKLNAITGIWYRDWADPFGMPDMG